MSLLREYVLLASQNEILKDPGYITEVLGIQIPLHESYPFSVGLEARILHEHMLLEGFFDGLKKLKDDALLFGKSLKEIISNPKRIGAFVGALHKSVIKRMLKPIKSFFKMIMEKFPKAMKEKFPTFIKAAESTLSFIDGVVEKVMAMDGWKKAIGTMALALGMKFIWDQVGELIEKGKEKLTELIPFFGEFDAIDAAGLSEDEGSGGKLEKAKELIKSFVDWFKDKIIGQVVEFVKKKLKEIGTSIVGDAISGGVSKAWEILKSTYGGAKFVMGTLAPAFKRFGRSSKQDGKIKSESVMREYIGALVESEYRRIQDESDQCTNATVLAIAHHFGDEVPPDACIGHVTGIDMHMYLKRDMGYKLENEYGWFQRSAMEGWRPTLKRFITDYPEGVYYLSSNRHAMALIDGQLVDTAEFRRLGSVKLVGAVRVEK